MTSRDSFQPKLVQIHDHLMWTEYISNPSTPSKLKQLTGNNHKQAFTIQALMLETCLTGTAELVPLLVCYLSDRAITNKSFVPFALIMECQYILTASAIICIGILKDSDHLLFDCQLKNTYISKTLVAFPYPEFVPSYLPHIDFSHSVSNGAWNDCALFFFIF